MKIKTSELIGAALDWAVAAAEGKNPYFKKRADGTKPTLVWLDDFNTARFTTDWAQGGPSIEREGINVGRHEWMGPSMEVISWSAERYATEKPGKQIGPTPLIAAMRCYVASKMGAEVEIPDDLAN